MSFEESLIRHASPTLASLKIANLYSFRFESVEECHETIEYFNDIMNPKGINVELVKNIDDFYLIYVYRKSQLRLKLEDASIRNFLLDYGYSYDSKLKDILDTLKIRLSKEKEFPHEIGVFLGYPLEDVKAFIETQGKDCVLCGDWKVYHDAEQAKCLFCKYKQCREMYMKVYRAGRRFSDMIVSA